MKPATWSERLRYRFDNVMAKGTPAMLAALGLVSLLFLLLFSVFIFATGVAPEEARGNFATIFWLNLLRTLDPGTMGADPMPYGLVTLGVTGVGIFLISALIGIINSGIGARLDQLLTQISENKQLNAVFADRFDPDGAEIYLKPAAAYVQPGVAVNFHTVVELARRRGEVALGYKQAALAGDAGRAYGVVVNPDKAEPVTFSDADRVIVLAES